MHGLAKLVVELAVYLDEKGELSKPEQWVQGQDWDFNGQRNVLRFHKLL